MALYRICLEVLEHLLDKLARKSPNNSHFRSSFEFFHQVNELGKLILCFQLPEGH